MDKTNLSELEEQFKSTSNTDAHYELDKKYYAYLENEIEKDPMNVQALIHLGFLSWEPFHQEKKAIDYLKKAIEYDPNNVDARFWLAKCYYHDCCDYEEARRITLEALKIDPKRSDCLSLLAMIIEDTTEDWNEAICYLKKAIQYTPDWPELHFFLASQYLNIKDIKSAEFEIEKALELSNIHIEKPKNAIEKYYELIVTGRNRTSESITLELLKERIREAKEWT